MPKSDGAKRRDKYMEYPECEFREGVYALAKSLQSQGLTIPDDFQKYVNHCDAVKRGE